MDHMSLGIELGAAAKVVGKAIAVHAETVETDPADVRAIIESANALREAVLNYEIELMRSYGWSNPIRHLGRLPQYASSDPSSSMSLSDWTADVRVTASYALALGDPELLANLAEGRGGPASMDAAAAVRYLFESDSWDLGQYPTDRIRLVKVDLSVEAQGGDQR